MPEKRERSTKCWYIKTEANKYALKKKWSAINQLYALKNNFKFKKTADEHHHSWKRDLGQTGNLSENDVE